MMTLLLIIIALALLPLALNVLFCLLALFFRLLPYLIMMSIGVACVLFVIVSHL